MVNPLHFDLQSLRVFALVAEHGSLTKAAEHGQLTLSAVSKRIAELESVTGSALFVRHARGVELTPAGRALLDHAAKVIEQVNRMAHEMSDYVAGVRGHIHVWTNTSAIVQFLPADLAAFLTDHPGIKVSLEERLSHEIVDALASGKADLGVFADNVPAPGIERRLYRRDELVLLVPRTHRFAARERIRFADTLDEDYVGLSDGSSLLARMTDAAFAAERSLKLRIQVSNFDGVSRMIEAGLGIGVLPRDAVTGERAARLGVVTLDDAWATRTLWVGVKAGTVLTTDVAKLFDFMSAR
ncbi:LysR family transcriptional regulator [Burkholderia cenocepacia]|uniref:LysR family transcriptional regulator n=1 Tax=Burkholderia cenocepacia TaxID=95486 RepID=UPI001B989F53|nr:LysR family transcriptional regulator [Burkholderia cenocepacia]MBR8212538.1 LysR family transcriptional regulator [Burkholderia cenocepacia]